MQTSKTEDLESKICAERSIKLTKPYKIDQEKRERRDRYQNEK